MLNSGQEKVRQHHLTKCAWALLKGGKYPEEGDDEDTKWLSNTKNKSLQGDHPLPRCLVYTCYCCTLNKDNKTTCKLLTLFSLNKKKTQKHCVHVLLNWEHKLNLYKSTICVYALLNLLLRSSVSLSQAAQIKSQNGYSLEVSCLQLARQCLNVRHFSIKVTMFHTAS